MKKFRKLLVWVVFINLFTAFSPHVSAQSRTFPSDTADLLDYLQKIYVADDRKVSKTIHESLDLMWNDPNFIEFRPILYNTTRELDLKKLRPDPFFNAFIDATLHFYKTGKSQEAYEAWCKGLTFIVRKKSNQVFLDFVRFSDGLFTGQRLYSSQGHEWSISTTDYVLDYSDEKGFLVLIPACTLSCQNRSDATFIYETSGSYDPLLQVFKGNKGSVYWTRHGLAPATVYADLASYEIAMNRATFKADSVWFLHGEYLSDPLLGTLEEKLTNTNDLSNSSFPKFDSYNKRIEIKNLDDEVDYEGGFSFYGGKFYGKGDSLNMAQLTFHKEGKTFMTATSEAFLIDAEKFVSNKAAVLMTFEEDSIYHPGAEFRYLPDKKEISLFRLNAFIAPFFDSFHKLEVFSEGLYWNKEEKALNISMIKGGAGSSANFRSYSFFTELEYERLQGMDGTFLTIKLNDMLRSRSDSTRFMLMEFARFLKGDVSETKQLLISWENAGLMQFNQASGEVVLNDKFYFYNNSRSALSDYDQIEFRSFTGQDNARLDLESKDLEMYGVDKVLLSDSQKVSVYPSASALVLKKNRDFDFGGRIDAGRMRMFGEKFQFSYDTFNIRLPFVDSIRTRVLSYEKNENGNPYEVKVTTLIHGVKGELQIDNSQNKSGQKAIPVFPILVSNEDSYTYYDNSFIESGVYTRDRFFFQLDPFTIDSLDNFPTESFRLDGAFHSADIFPVIRQQLIVMPDYALGFGMRTETSGLPAYEGKGQFFDSLSLSNKGLRGDGRLEFLNSVSYSHHYKFYPDSMNVITDSIRIDNKNGLAETPVTFALATRIHWEPPMDHFYIFTIDKPIELYDSQALFTGRLALNQNGLEGKGKIQVGKAVLTSERFRFTKDGFEADTADFALVDYNLSNKESSGVAIQTKNFKAVVSFTERKGTFTSNDEISEVDFPMNKFKARIEEVIWDMGDTSRQGPDETVISLKNADFSSTGQGKDSLKFFSEQAQFFLKDKTIDAGGVAYIDVADSRIFPGLKKIVIKNDATLDPISEATIWIGKENQDYVLENGEITVESGSRYRGKAEFTYIQENGTPHKVFFADIDVPDDKNTKAVGEISDTNHFWISEEYKFKGTIILNGNKKRLTFNGYGGLNTHCPFIFNTWVRFNAAVDPESVLLPVSRTPLNEKGEKLFNGFIAPSDSAINYPVLSGEKQAFYNEGLPSSECYLYFDKEYQEYLVVESAVIFDDKKPDEVLSFSPASCDSIEPARFAMGYKFGQTKIRGAGKILATDSLNRVETEMMLTVDFEMYRDALRYLEGVAGQGKGSFKFSENKRAVSQLSRNPEETEGDLQSDGTYDYLPEVLQKTLVFSGVKFLWNPAESKWVHRGKLFLMAINGEQSLKECEAYIEINRGGKEETYSIYLEFEDNIWFIYHYVPGIMKTLSAEKAYNDLIKNLEPSKRQFNQKGRPDYQFMLADPKVPEEIKKRIKTKSNP